MEVNWDSRREARRWSPGEALQRFDLTPDKFEMTNGQLFWSDDERLTLLGLLLENVGVDAAVKLGDATVWRAAVAARHAEH